MKRTWTIIGVRDVSASFHWYQSLFGQLETSPAHADFGQILDSDGTVLLCLHEWGAHEHPSLMSPDHATPGNGLLLFFRVDDLGMALARARALVARLEEEPHVRRKTTTSVSGGWASQSVGVNGRVDPNPGGGEVRLRIDFDNVPARWQAVPLGPGGTYQLALTPPAGAVALHVEAVYRGSRYFG